MDAITLTIGFSIELNNTGKSVSRTSHQSSIIHCAWLYDEQKVKVGSLFLFSACVNKL